MTNIINDDDAHGVLTKECLSFQNVQKSYTLSLSINLT